MTWPMYIPMLKKVHNKEVNKDRDRDRKRALDRDRASSRMFGDRMRSARDLRFGDSVASTSEVELGFPNFSDGDHIQR